MIVVPEQKNNILNLFSRYLSVWIALCILLGVFLGNFIPDFFQFISELEYARVNLVIAVLIWIMIYPMMINIDFNSLKYLYKKPKGLCVTLVVNWFIKPFTMAFLGIFFFKIIFVDLVNPDDAKEYIAGMILLGIAPCTAMVFVWSKLTKGDAVYTLIQVSINDIIMIFAFAPIAAFLLGITDIIIPWKTLLLSVILYVLIPMIAGYVTRETLVRSGNKNNVENFLKHIEPYSMVGLLLTVVILFGLQASIIINKPFIILLIAIPLIIQSYGIFLIAYIWSYFWKIPHNIAAPSALIGTSNFFELAIAVAISLFGLESGAALATVVGVLVEVPVMLSLVAIINRTRGCFA